MNEFMSKSINRKKYLIWTLFDDDDDNDEANANQIFKIKEFRVCDCYLDWILYFQFINKETIFSNELSTTFFDEIPLEGNDIAEDCDIFVVFGKISIVCCERALYHLSYKKDIPHEQFYYECVGDQFECCCLYLLERKLFFPSLCINCQFNFLKNSSKTFLKIKK